MWIQNQGPNAHMPGFTIETHHQKDQIQNEKGGVLVRGNFKPRALEWAWTKSLRTRIWEIAARTRPIVLNIASILTFRYPVCEILFSSWPLLSLNASSTAVGVLKNQTTSDHQYIPFASSRKPYVERTSTRPSVWQWKTGKNYSTLNGSQSAPKAKTR